MIKRICSILILTVLIVGITACKTDTDDKDISWDENNSDVVEEEKGVEDGGNNNEIEYELTDEGIIESESAEMIIEGISNELIYAISVKDFETVSGFTHPVEGIRFTPYTNVSLDNDIVFSQGEIENFFDDQDVYIWGIYDGIGDEISLTPNQYYDRFIYTSDFKNAEEIGYNEVLGMGNMIENQFEIYDNAIIVEYYFSGFNPDYEGMDWESLRLVFQQYQNDWSLVGIIHNQWII